MEKDDKKLVVSLFEERGTQKAERDTKNLAIRDMIEAGFGTVTSSNPRQVHSKLLIQVRSQLATMMKFLDFRIESQGRSIGKIATVTEGVSTICDTGGLDEVMRDEGGVFEHLIDYGNGFFTVNLNDDEKEKTKVPIVFSSYTNSNVIIDNNATRMRGRSGKGAVKAMVYSEFIIEEAKRIFGEDVIGEASGKIPRNNTSLDALDKKDSQNNNDEEKKIEIGYFWHIGLKKYLVFAGSEMVEIENKSGDDYPYMIDGVPYIPLFNFVCITSSNGFYSHGASEYAYELGAVNQKLLNLGINHAYKGANPLPIINVPQGKSKKFIKQIDSANRALAQGKEAYAVVEYDPASAGSSMVTSSTINTQSLINEWIMIRDTLTNELKRIGINVDVADRGANITASQIISEEEARGAFVKQIMEYNASETQFMLRVVLNLLKSVSVKNKTPLNTTIKFEDKDVGEVEVDNITFGDVSSELKKHDYYPIVNSRTGVFPTNIMKQASVARVLPSLMPGSPAHTKTLREFASLNNQNFTLEDFAMAQQGGGGEITDDVPITGTDRMAVNPRQKTPEPVF